ncbi:MAG: hypothetical protein LUC93_05870 [Planctomycetaceae bacterium]|nr:hypothetical protein [Planctomycetaceae bacterium]
MSHLTKRAVVFVALFAAALCLQAAEAGQPRNPVPSRVKKAEKGDWVLIKYEDRMVLETVTDMEEVEDDLMLHYTMQDIALDGKADAPKNVVRLQSDETMENMELVTSPGAKVDKKRGRVEGKNVNVVSITVPEEGGTIEYWLSDDVGVDGKVAMIVKFPEMEAYKAMEVIGFGDAKTPFQLNKYIR